ncbi:MAG TPA: SGNH/GDSL hydrolase family protein [Desulfitobacteriaceae bacterium]|nr:SGNH/GDSL hydrolase family protein [Desulfitobacteriaceae bacterium]
MKTRRITGLMLAALLFFLTACAGKISTQAAAAATQQPQATAIATQAAAAPTVPPQPNATATMVDTRKPLGIIAIGHSGLTGESSDTTRLPGMPALENSWATGNSSKVNSVYKRLAAVYPEIVGHVANEAVGGSLVTDLADQARAALQKVPNPQLVIIKTIDNDIRCDGSDQNFIKGFGNAVAEALDVIVKASPDSKILIVSQPGRPATNAAATAVDPNAVAKIEGTGICAMFNPDGSMNKEHIATLTGIIESYEAEQTRVCSLVPQCKTDGGAFATYIDDISRMTPDLGHLTVEGQARLAEIIWPVVSNLLALK